jgi:adenine deaminase
MLPLEGELRADPEHDLLKASIITSEGEIFTGFVRGLGIKRGALAISSAWETSGIIAVGGREEDIARAVNRVSELEGGIVLCADGQVQAELPLPIGGILSNRPIEDVAQMLDEIQNKVRGWGFSFDDIFLTLSTLTTPAIPFLRISEDGLVDIRKGKGVDLITS